MSNYHKIEFYRYRDFGGIITTTFDFIAQNFKILIQLLLRISLPLLLFGYVVVIYSYYQVVHNTNAASGRVFLMILGILLFLAGMSLYYFSIYFLMRRYDEVDDPSKIKASEVWSDTVSHIKSYLVATLLITLIVGFSYMFFVIPGLILFVFLSLVYPAMIFEEINASQSISRSFSLVAGNWWRTFFLLLILNLIQMMFNYLADMPAYIAHFLGLIRFNSSITYLANTTVELWEWLLWAVYFFIQYLILVILGIISTIGTSFLYFSIRERKENTGLIREIQAFGTHKNEDDYEYEF